MKPVSLEQKQKLNKTILILVLAILVGISILAYSKGINFLKVNSSYEEKKVNIKPIFQIPINSFDSNLQFIPYNNKILRVTNNKIEALNFDKKVKWQINFNLLNPLIKANNKYLLIADKNGKNLYLFQDDNKLWDRAVDGPIENVKLGKNGYVLVFIKTKSSRDIIVFNLKGEKVLYKAYPIHEYLVNADISSDSKKVATVSIVTTQNKVSSKIELFQIKANGSNNLTPTFSIVKNDLLVTDIKIFNENTIILVGDNKITAVDDAGNDKWIKDIGNLKVYKADISSGNYIVLEVSNPNNLLFSGREIQVLNSEGVMEGESIKINSAIVNMDVFENYFLVNDSSNIYSISKGKLIWNWQNKENIEYVKGFEGKAQILVVTKNSAKVIQVD